MEKRDLFTRRDKPVLMRMGVLCLQVNHHWLSRRFVLWGAVEAVVMLPLQLVRQELFSWVALVLGARHLVIVVMSEIVEWLVLVR